MTFFVNSDSTLLSSTPSPSSSSRLGVLLIVRTPDEVAGRPSFAALRFFAGAISRTRGPVMLVQNDPRPIVDALHPHSWSCLTGSVMPGSSNRRAMLLIVAFASTIRGISETCGE